MQEVLPGYAEEQTEMLFQEMYCSDLTEYGLDKDRARVLGIIVPKSLDEQTKKDMVYELNTMSFGDEDRIGKIRDSTCNLNSALAHHMFTIDVNANSSESKKKDINYRGLIEGATFATVTEYSKLVRDASEKVANLNRMFNTPIKDVGEILEESKGNARIAKLLSKYSNLTLRELAAAGKGSRASKSAFNSIFKVCTDEIDETAKSVNNGALAVLDSKIGQMKKLYNVNDDTVYLRKLLRNGTVLNSLEDAKNLVKYAKLGRYLGRGAIGAGVILNYANLINTPDSEFARTFVGDTGALIGSSLAASAGTTVTMGTLGLILGDTLLCCGPIGWGVLIAGAIVGTATGYLGSWGGEKVGDFIWDHVIEPNKEAIEKFFIDEAKCMRYSRGIY